MSEVPSGLEGLPPDFLDRLLSGKFGEITPATALPTYALARSQDVLQADSQGQVLGSSPAVQQATQTADASHEAAASEPDLAKDRAAAEAAARVVDNNLQQKAVAAKLQQETRDSALRKEIAKLPEGQQKVLTKASTVVRDLVSAWGEGAMQARAGYRSSFIEDDSTLGLALSGNLMWAATSIAAIAKIPYLAIGMSFVGAAIGTLGAIPSTYDTVFARVTENLEDRINRIEDAMMVRNDVITYEALKILNITAFGTLESPDQYRAMWPLLFDVPLGDSDGEYRNPTRRYLLANLQQADHDAAEIFQQLERAWSASMVSINVPRPEPPAPAALVELGVFDERKWSEHTKYPAWIYLGSNPHQGDLFYIYRDPCPESGKRRALVLTIAIERRWPSPTGMRLVVVITLLQHGSHVLANLRDHISRSRPRTTSHYHDLYHVMVSPTATAATAYAPGQ
jgi:hypothetical protein